MPTLKGFHTSKFMEKTKFDDRVNLLIWGVLLLGGIGFLIVWGLSNAYPEA